ncbi:Hypothetical predicted protein [Cloeon dipterum]|uniref:Uncharacterized protein n=1 Tax=Cloeon dipterum TaxID=197152 RepID=A0A8S1EBC8_9INSE|nr:Hypothetical predicted protein [Cloeon dipterum]
MGQNSSTEKQAIKGLPTGTNRLLFAAHKLDLQAVIKQIKKGNQIHSKSPSGASVLHFAAANKAHGREIVKYLLSQNLNGIGLHTQDHNGAEPIHYAIHEGCFHTASDLLTIRGVDPELLHFSVQQNQLDFAKRLHEYYTNLIHSLDPYGRNVLHLAAQYADLKMCQWLIGIGLSADTVGVSSGDSVLHYAARNKAHGWEIILFLNRFMPTDLDINARNSSDETPLHAALKVENISAAINIHRLEADLGVKLDGENLLEFCVSHNVLSSAQFVVQYDRKNYDNGTRGQRNILLFAAEKAGVEMYEWIAVQRFKNSAAQDDAKRNALHYAALNEHHGAEVIHYFVFQKGLNVNRKDSSGRTPLCIALEAGSTDCAMQLILSGASLQVNNANILHHCILHNKLEGAKFVHEKFPNMINESNSNGLTAFLSAVVHADVEMCQWLIDQGAGIQPSDANALHYASSNETHGKEIVPFLVSQGWNVNRENKFQETPLYRALIIAENFEVAKTLMELGATLDTQAGNENILVSCIRLKKFDCADFILKNDESLINRLGARGETALHVAAEKYNQYTCIWLLKKGADVRALSSQGSSVLHFAAANKVGNSLKIFLLFTSLGLDVNEKNKLNETPLHVAIIKGNEDVVQELCKMGADLRVKINGENLLHFCARHKRLKSAKLLVAKERKLLKEVDSFGRTALHIAATSKDAEFCKWLIEEGINVNAVSKDGRKANLDPLSLRNFSSRR